jgi:hypothetical protein
MFKRVLPIAGALGALGALTVALASSAAAGGGGGGYGGPGSFKFDDTNAYANFVDSSGTLYSTVSVDRGMQSFKLRHTPGAPVVEQYGTVLNVIEQSGKSFNFGCWIIPDSAFVIANDLSSASLKVHATSDLQCQGYYAGGAAGGKPGLQSAFGYGGGGGGSNQITDITVNLTWSGNGGLWHNDGQQLSHCQAYTNTFHNSYDYEFATAAGSLGALSDLSDPLAQVAHSLYVTNSNSVPSAACNPYGF